VVEKTLNTLQYVIEKYQLRIGRHSPVEIPNMIRENLAELFGELGFTVGAEIGVLYGAFSKQICQKNPNLKLYCIDPYLAYDGFIPGPLDQKAQDDIYEACRETMAPYNHEFIRKTSVEAAKDFKDESLDFFYLDANHRFEHVVADLATWIPKVRSGGIISGHDLHRMSLSTDTKNNPVHVLPALYGYTDAYRIHPWFAIGERFIQPGGRRDKYRSWMWVKT